MPQIFIGPENYRNGVIVIEGDDFHHLSRVRRVRAGSLVRLRDREGRLIEARVSSIAGGYLELLPQEVRDGKTPGRDLTLCMALLKGKKLDLVIQKCTEVGVGRMVPFVSRRTVSQPGEGGAGKVRRWRKIVEEASKQCMRSRVPVLEDIETFSSLLSREREGVRIMASPGAPMDFREFLEEEKGMPAAGISLMVGPEGGFSPEEIVEARDAGWTDVSFGFNELRAETAGIVLPAVILYEMGE